MPYELMDHTADLGIRVTGNDIKELFAAAASAMFEQMTDLAGLKGEHQEKIEVSGRDQTDLMINWLRELLSFWTLNASLVKRVMIDELTPTHLIADIFYDRYSPGHHEMDTEIKAVTYHKASVAQTGTGWEATVIFDV